MRAQQIYHENHVLITMGKYLHAFCLPTQHLDFVKPRTGFGSALVPESGGPAASHVTLTLRFCTHPGRGKKFVVYGSDLK